MARKFLTPIDLSGLELQNARIQNLTSDPTATKGRIYFDSTNNLLKVSLDGSTFATLSTGGGSFTLGNTSISLGSTTTTIAGLSSVTSTTFVGALTGNASTATTASATTGTLTFGTGLTAGGASFNGSANVTITPVSATTSVAGIVQLSDSTSTTSSTLAATATAVKAAYDRGSTGVTNAATAQSTADAALPKAGGTMSGAIAMGNNKITGLATPTDAGDAATKSYVDNVSTGVNIHDAVVAATTGTIAGVYAAGSTTANPPGDGGTGVGATITYSATGVVTLDTSVTLAQGDRVLVKDGVTAAAGASSIANGIYVVTTAGAVGTAAVLTRSTDADNSHFGDLSAGDLVYVIGGNTYAGDQFVQTVKGTATQGTGADTTYSVKIGTDAISYTQFSGAGAVPIATTSTAGIASFSSSNFAVNGSGVVTLTAVEYSALPTSVGVVARKVSLVGTGSGTTIALTHGLGTNLVTAQVYDTSTSTATLVEVDITVTSTTATATFASTTTLSNYTLVVVG
jgi:hypothetical protein